MIKWSTIEAECEGFREGFRRHLQEVLALPQAEEGDLLDYLGSAFAPPGLGNWTVVDLSAGRHAALCFIPTGATTPEAATGQIDDTTQLHATQGMFAEMQVSWHHDSRSVTTPSKRSGDRGRQGLSEGGC